MTSRSRKKRPTTARTSVPATRNNPRRRRAGRLATAIACLAVAPTMTLWLDAGSVRGQDGARMMPVPKPSSAMAQPAAPDPTREGWNLQWRRSGRVAPTQAPATQDPATGVQAVQPASHHAAASHPATGLQISRRPAQLRPVSQTAYQNQGQPSGEKPDFFQNPFGDEVRAMPTPPTSVPNPQQLSPGIDPRSLPQTIPPSLSPTAPQNAAPGFAPSGAPSGGMTLPPDQPMNDLRGAAGGPATDVSPNVNPSAQDVAPEPRRLEDLFSDPVLPSGDPIQPDAAQPDAAPPTRDAGPSLGDMLRDSEPDPGQFDPGQLDAPETAPRNPADDALDSPSDRNVQELPPPRRNADDDKFENPFPRSDARDADARDRDRLNDTDDDDDRTLGPMSDDDDLKRSPRLTCDEFRSRIAFQTIDKISLDISPPYRPDEISPARYERLREDFDEKQSVRQWRNIAGVPLASGRLRDLAYEKAVIETEFGTTEELSINDLSEADLAYISDSWGLPKECLIEQVAYVPRQWASMTMTWKASNLMHHPLYFEDVNLERYGHTHGPILEPFVQSAHFFGGILVLPYKMGVHGPHECQYALGYYRPGNCAPWIKPPVPISLRGAVAQGAVMTGMFWLIP